MPRTKKTTTASNSPKNIPTVPESEWPYQVPENWRWVKLDSIAEKMSDGPFGSNLKTEHYTTNKEVRIIQLSNIGEDGWRDENVKYTTFEHAKEIQRSIVNPGELIIAKMMPAGRAIICPNDEKMYILSSDAVKLVPIKNINTKYLLYTINSPFFRNQVHDNTQGITRARTSINKLKDYPIPLPPLAEQQRIVDRIERLFAKLDEAREKAQAVVDGFENRKAAILHQAFTGELTKKWREERGIGMESWNVNILKDCCDIGSGGTPSRKTPEYYNGKIPWVKTGEICWNEIYDTEEHISDSALNNSSAKLYQPGVVLVAMYGMGITRGRAAILRNCAATNQAVCVLSPHNNLLNIYLYYYFMCNYWLIREQAVGGNQLNLSGTIIEGFKIYIPPLQEQTEIVRILDSMLDKEQRARDLAESVIVQIDGMKKAILARAFRGELGTNVPGEAACEG